MEQVLEMGMNASNAALPAIIEAEKKKWESEQWGSLKPSESGECFECGGGGGIHDHHVVPRILGGTKTIPLCESCHSKVHVINMVGHSRLIRLGVESARRKGKTIEKVKKATP